MLQGADLDVGVDQPAQARGERGHADVPVGAVGDDDDVGAQPVRVRGQELARVGDPISSSPSTSTVTPTGSSSP